MKRDTPRPRFAIVDIARGVAIIAMVAYHLCWDLSYFRFISADVGYDPQWVFIARSILAVFLLLVGIGLVLGHGKAIRWRSFWRRWVFVVAGALIITAATWFSRTMRVDPSALVPVANGRRSRSCGVLRASGDMRTFTS